jgi:hypothetical protein
MPKFKKVIRKKDGGGVAPDPAKGLANWLRYKEGEQALGDESYQLLPFGNLLPFGKLLPRASRVSSQAPVRFATDAGSRALPAASQRLLESGVKALPGPTSKALTRTGAELVKPASSSVAKVGSAAAPETGKRSIGNLLKSIGAGAGVLGMSTRSEDPEAAANDKYMREMLAYQTKIDEPPPISLSKSKAEKEAATASATGRAASSGKSVKQAPMPKSRKQAPIPNYLDRDMEFVSQMSKSDPELMKAIALGLPSLPKEMSEGEESELASIAATSGKGKSTAEGAVPKTKAGFKKFMQDYGKFIALGAVAGAGGKRGQIAAPIIAALPGLIEMMKKRGKKSSGGDTPKKSEGGAIRKFKGGSMNTKDSMFTPKYKKGGDMPKGKATGEMPQHKKMAMGKPTPQSTGQKFAKGGAAKYAGGGMCKGYGIAKKIRPTGPMN